MPERYPFAQIEPKWYLAALGIARERISTVSYGEERPFAEGSTESAWRPAGWSESPSPPVWRRTGTPR